MGLYVTLCNAASTFQDLVFNFPFPSSKVFQVSDSNYRGKGNPNELGSQYPERWNFDPLPNLDLREKFANPLPLGLRWFTWWLWNHLDS